MVDEKKTAKKKKHLKELCCDNHYFGLDLSANKPSDTKHTHWETGQKSVTHEIFDLKWFSDLSLGLLVLLFFRPLCSYHKRERGKNLEYHRADDVYWGEKPKETRFFYSVCPKTETKRATGNEWSKRVINLLSFTTANAMTDFWIPPKNGLELTEKEGQ